MPTIVMQADGEPEQTLDVTRTCTAGGGEGDDIRLAGLAEGGLLLAPAPGGVLIESRQPLTVAGRLVPAGTRRLLRRGERADADGWALWPDSPDVEETTRELVGASLAGGLPVAPRAGPGVLVLEGPTAGQRHSIATGTIVGRGEGADLRLPDPLASRRHLRVELRGRSASARDLGSKNGITLRTTLDGAVRERRVRGRRVPLRSGDEIEVGTTLLLYEDIVATAPEGTRRSSGRSRLRRRIITVLASVALLAVAALLARAAG